MDFTDNERRMIRELLTGHLTNLEGHREAVAGDASLALVADVGYAEIDEQIRVATDALARLAGGSGG